MRSLLVQEAQYMLRRQSPDSDLKRWGLQLCARGGKDGKKRAVVAVARKLAVLLHRLWVDGTSYQAIRSKAEAAVIAARERSELRIFHNPVSKRTSTDVSMRIFAGWY
jgi:transposase